VKGIRRKHHAPAQGAVTAGFEGVVKPDHFDAASLKGVERISPKNQTESFPLEVITDPKAIP